MSSGWKTATAGRAPARPEPTVPPTASRRPERSYAPPPWRSPSRLWPSSRSHCACIGRRDDGFHLIDAEMVTVDLADELVFTDGDGLEVTATDAEWPEVGVGRRQPRPQGAAGGRSHRSRPSDEAHPARSRARRRFGRRRRGVPLGRRRRFGLAATVGADVPFCVRGGRARVTGIGEIVDPLPAVDRTFTLALAPFACSTVAVYQAWDRLGGPTAGDRPNDLEAAALAVEPRLAEWRDRLADATGRDPCAGRQRQHVVRRGRVSRAKIASSSEPQPHRRFLGQGFTPGLDLCPRNCGTEVARQATGERSATSRRDVASGSASASSCAFSCACACGAS